MFKYLTTTKSVFFVFCHFARLALAHLVAILVHAPAPPPSALHRIVIAISQTSWSFHACHHQSGSGTF